MKQTGIIMSGAHPLKVLDGTLTMTRRTWGLEFGLPNTWDYSWNCLARQHEFYDRYFPEAPPLIIKCPYGGVGDLLWMKETWSIGALTTGHEADVFYRASGIHFHKTIPWNEWLAKHWDDNNWDRWRSPRFMPRWASRATLEITEVRVERLQEITEEDCFAEGIDFNQPWGFPDGYINSFAWLWDSLNAKRGYSWLSNPWVFVITFKKLD